MTGKLNLSLAGILVLLVAVVGCSGEAIGPTEAPPTLTKGTTPVDQNDRPVIFTPAGNNGPLFVTETSPPSPPQTDHVTPVDKTASSQTTDKADETDKNIRTVVEQTFVEEEGGIKKTIVRYDDGTVEVVVTKGWRDGSVVRIPVPEDPHAPLPIQYGFSGIEIHQGAATPSVDRRILISDVVLRATYVSETADTLAFNAVEYLKGSGPTSIVIEANTAGRPTTWDNREAILFLKGAGSRQTRSAAQFTFTEATPDHYQGDLPVGFALGSRTAAWIPAISTSGASGDGVSGDSDSQSYIADPATPLGDPNPEVTLSDIRSAIAWHQGGAGIDGYDECIRRAVSYEQWHRDYQAYYDSGWVTREVEDEISAGTPRGTVIKQFFHNHEGSRYDIQWVSGEDAGHFEGRNVDADGDDVDSVQVPSTGYYESLLTTRPLVGGTYNITAHRQIRWYQPCNFIPTEHKLNYTITVTPTEGVLHETLFDPVTLTAGVGATTNQGAISHRDFSVGGSSGSVSVLRWRNGKVVLKLDPFVSLAGYRLDFIETDGSVGLSLDAASATEDSGAKTLRWDVAEQPWEDGDLLMVRIGPSLQVSISADNPSPTAGQAVTFTPAITNAPQNPTPTYDWQFDFGDGDWLSAASGRTLKTQGNAGETVGYRVVVKYGSGAVATSGTVTVSWP